MAKWGGKWSTMDEHPMAVHHLVGPPKKGFPPFHVIPRYFGTKPKKVAFHKVIQKALSLFTTTYLSVHSNWKYSCGLRTFPVPTKIIFNAIRNNSGLVIFICEKHLKRFRQLRNISSFHPGKFQKVSERFWHPPRIIRHVLKPIWLNGIPWNNFSVLPELFRCTLRNVFVASETFPVIFSQTPCLVFSR